MAACRAGVRNIAAGMQKGPTGNAVQRCSQWRAMGLKNRSSMERSTAGISAVPNVPSAVPAVGP